MRRKNKAEEHVNHESWAIPYGDLVTLLLALFVVLYAVSSVNEGKYRAVADSLTAAFRGPPRAMNPIQVGAFQVRADAELETSVPRTLVPFEVDGFPGVARSTAEDEEGEEVADFKDGPQAVPESGVGPAGGSGQDAGPDDDSSWVVIERLEEEVLVAMAPLIEADLIRVQRVSYWLEVEINTNFLFASGSAAVAPSAVPAIRSLGGLLGEAGVRLQVEGHTDNVPISTDRFPSNWELSASRAASVVHLLSAYGLDPASMAAVGYGEHRPVADNDTRQGRRKNRRVLLIVLSGQQQERELAGASAEAAAASESAS